MNKYKIVCSRCGSEDSLRWDAWATWSEEEQHLVLYQTFDDIYCEICEAQGSDIRKSVKIENNEIQET